MVKRLNENLVKHEGRIVLLNSQYSICDTCHSEQTNHIQVLNNKQEMLKFKIGDFSMTRTEIIEYIAKKLSQYPGSSDVNHYNGICEYLEDMDDDELIEKYTELSEETPE